MQNHVLISSLWLSGHLFFTISFSLSAGPDWSCFLGLYPLGFPRHCPLLVDILLIGYFDGHPFSPFGEHDLSVKDFFFFNQFCWLLLSLGLGNFQSNNLRPEVSSFLVLFLIFQIASEISDCIWAQNTNFWLSFYLFTFYTYLSSFLKNELWFWTNLCIPLSVRVTGCSAISFSL